jgi:hypothetical protein
VLVFFDVEPGRRPRITGLERRGEGADPPFSATRFSIPGTVRRSGDAMGLVARVGNPPVSVELDLPASIPIEDAALDQLAAFGIVRAGLRQGFLGHRYLTDVRLSGQGWTEEISFAYDESRDRLVVLAPQRQPLYRERLAADRPARSSIFIFDGVGKEMTSVEVTGRLVEGVINPSDGTLWALVSPDPWGHYTVQLTRIREDGTVLQRGPQVAYERILGFDAGDGALWVLAGAPNSSPLPPFFVEQMTLGEVPGPRLGPFSSKPRSILTRGQQLWVLEPDQDRVTRMDRTGRIQWQSRDMNHPTDIAVDGGFLILVEAARTQLSKFSMEGELIWRVPRFQELSWVLPEGETGGGWVGARRFEGREGGVFRYDPDGKISRVSAAVTPRTIGDWNRAHLAPHAARARTHGRLYIREDRAIAILGPDGTLLKRIEGFRYGTEQRVRN